MRFKIDLHVHSKYSGDTDSEPEESVIRAVELGLNGIAFTEHYSYEASEPVEALKEKYRDAITIFRGVEFSSEEGHCLIFGVDTDMLLGPHAPIEEVLNIVNRAGGIVIPSHPYRRGNSLGEKVLTLPGLCAIEGFNGANPAAFNEKAVETAEDLGIPYTGGSDAHEPGEVGSCFTGFTERIDHNNFITLLKRGNYRGVDTRKISRGWRLF
ncbi:MAG: PHP domain-containing protein [Thermodesulfovibrionales bacterium]